MTELPKEQDLVCNEAWADVLEARVHDERCLVVGTFSGATTVTKQGLVLCDMIENGMLGAVVSKEGECRFAEVPADATIAWPPVVAEVLQRLNRSRGV